MLKFIDSKTLYTVLKRQDCEDFRAKMLNIEFTEQNMEVAKILVNLQSTRRINSVWLGLKLKNCKKRKDYK